jgi:hypothetical protein
MEGSGLLLVFDRKTQHSAVKSIFEHLLGPRPIGPMAMPLGSMDQVFFILVLVVILSVSVYKIK